MDVIAVLLIGAMVSAMFIFGRALARIFVFFFTLSFIIGVLDPGLYIPWLSQLGVPQVILEELVSLHNLAAPCVLWLFNAIRAVTGG